MNCKPGDLAVVVRAAEHAKNCIGKLITVEKTVSGTHWRYSPMLYRATDGLPINYVEDECLRPIRNHPDDAVDEMLVITGKPVKEAA